MTVPLSEELRRKLEAFHRSCGLDRYPTETMRELLEQALSGDAVETAAFYARREVFRQVQAWVMSRMQTFLNELKVEIEQISWTITDGDVQVHLPEER